MSKRKRDDDVDSNAVADVPKKSKKDSKDPETKEAKKQRKAEKKESKLKDKSEKAAKREKKQKKKEKEGENGAVVNGEGDGVAEEKTTTKKHKDETPEEKTERKRKRKEEKQLKKAKSGKDEPGEREHSTPDATEVPNGDSTAVKPADGEKAHRFIVFVGNLPYDTTTASMKEHFASVNPTSVRHITEKSEDPEKEGKSKGFGFLEFDAYDRMDTCLQNFHRRKFNGRRINIELTAGGGGTSTDRKQKIKDKNEKFSEERKKRLTKIIDEKDKARDGAPEEKGKADGKEKADAKKQVDGKSGAEAESKAEKVAEAGADGAAADFVPLEVGDGDIHPSRRNMMNNPVTEEDVVKPSSRGPKKYDNFRKGGRGGKFQKGGGGGGRGKPAFKRR